MHTSKPKPTATSPPPPLPSSSSSSSSSIPSTPNNTVIYCRGTSTSTNRPCRRPITLPSPSSNTHNTLTSDVGVGGEDEGAFYCYQHKGQSGRRRSRFGVPFWGKEDEEGEEGEEEEGQRGVRVGEGIHIRNRLSTDEDEAFNRELSNMSLHNPARQILDCPQSHKNGARKDAAGDLGPSPSTQRRANRPTSKSAAGSKEGNASPMFKCEGYSKKTGKRCSRKFRDPSYDLKSYDGLYLCHIHRAAAESHENANTAKKIELEKYISPLTSEETRRMLLTELEKPLSKSDRPGFIYIFRMMERKDGNRKEASGSPPNLFKIGRTSNPHRRMAEWGKQCKYVPKMMDIFPSSSASSSSTVNSASPLRSSSASPQSKHEIPSTTCSRSPFLAPLPSQTQQQQSMASSPSPLRFSHRAERLIHIELRDRFWSGPIVCKNCGDAHYEWFKVNGGDADEEDSDDREEAQSELEPVRNDMMRGDVGDNSTEKNKEKKKKGTYEELRTIVSKWVGYVQEIYGQDGALLDAPAYEKVGEDESEEGADYSSTSGGLSPCPSPCWSTVYPVSPISRRSRADLPPFPVISIQPPSNPAGLMSGKDLGVVDGDVTFHSRGTTNSDGDDEGRGEEDEEEDMYYTAGSDEDRDHDYGTPDEGAAEDGGFDDERESDAISSLLIALTLESGGKLSPSSSPLNRCDSKLHNDLGLSGMDRQPSTLSGTNSPLSSSSDESKVGGNRLDDICTTQSGIWSAATSDGEGEEDGEWWPS
ncbi:hypothetical protein HK102_004608, partial [Quaeritorhiza haematococci]